MASSLGDSGRKEWEHGFKPGGLGMRLTLLCNFGLSSVSISRAGSQNQGFSITVLSISPVLAFFPLGEWHGLLRHSLM